MDRDREESIGRRKIRSKLLLLQNPPTPTPWGVELPPSFPAEPHTHTFDYSRSRPDPDIRTSSVKFHSRHSKISLTLYLISCIVYQYTIHDIYTIQKGGKIMANTAPREGITYEQVAATADAMVGQGLNPTIRSIRDAIGGSPNTVHKHLSA